MIEYHENRLAINVKDYHLYAQDSRFDGYSEQELNTAYESCKEAFWENYAPDVAEKYGYGKVFSEGRSGGWLVVENPPVLDPADYDIQDPKEAQAIASRESARWEDFSREILTEMDYCCNDRLLEVLKESRQLQEQSGF